MEDSVFNILNAKFNAKQAKEVNQISYLTELIIATSSMFDWTLDEKIATDSKTIEKILAMNGSVVCGKEQPGDQNYHIGIGSFGGELDSDGVGHLLYGQLLNGHLLQGERNINAVIGFNNSCWTPNYDVINAANLLTETDISMLNNVIYSRQYPIYGVRDNQTAEKIAEFFKRVKQGIPLTIAKKANSLVGAETPDVTRLDITDVKDIDKLQYLTQFKESLYRHFYTKYGINVSNGTKVAQQSVEEVDSNASRAMVIPFDMLKARQKFCDDLNSTFSLNCSVKFSEAWQVEMKEWEQKANNTEHYEISAAIGSEEQVDIEDRKAVTA